MATAPLWGQTPLTLRDAVGIALEKNPMRKAALADQRAAKAGVGQARSFLLPHATFSEGFTRGDDPVYVFGSKLRQQSFTAADFALPVLNTPGPLNNWSTRIATQWNVFDSGVSWFGLSRSRKLAEAAGQQLERSDQELLYRVVNAYYGALLADKQVEVADAAVKSAQSVLELTSSRHQAGMVVEADLLSAQVNRGNRQQELIRAKNNALLARAQLNNELGVSLASDYTLPQQLVERELPAVNMAELETTALDKRPDLRRVRLEQEAQGKGIASAKGAFGPRLNFFLGWESDNRNFTSNGGNNVVGGFELQVDIFQGGAKAANLSLQKAYGERIAAMRTAAENGARLDVRRAYLDWDANRQQLEVARTSVDQAKESLRIMQNRYESGLVTMTELLRAEEAADFAQTNYWQAVYRVQTSYAGVELAAGTLNAQSPVVMP
jgi:outer membrane protein TolC